jgi:hypothetical protein
MDVVTLKSLHAYLRLLENTAELKRKMPASSNPRTFKEGLNDIARLAGVDETVFKDPRHIAALIGDQRFIMILGEPSASDLVARVFDGARVLLTVLLDLAQYAGASTGQRGSRTGVAPQPTSGMPVLSTVTNEAQGEWPRPQVSNAEAEISVDSLKPLVAGNTALACRLFRVLFEHLLGFTLTSTAQHGGLSLVNDLAGSREHSRAFQATALFMIGTEIDRENLMPFMMQQGLFGMPMLEHLLQNRDYCDAFLTFRRLERAFMGSPEAERTRLSNRLDQLNAQFGGKPHADRLFESGGQDKAMFDANLAATDLLEAMALTPWRMSLANAVSEDPSHSIRSVASIAGLFERFGRGETTREQANRQTADHWKAPLDEAWLEGDVVNAGNLDRDRLRTSPARFGRWLCLVSETFLVPFANPDAMHLDFTWAGQSLGLRANSNEHVVGLRAAANCIVGAIGEPVCLNRQREPIGAGQVRRIFRVDAPHIRAE